VKEGTVINSLNKKEILMKTERRREQNMNACYPFKIA
jgi:hypothetical protein